MKLKINSPNVRYTDEFIESEYVYRNTAVDRMDDIVVATPTQKKYNFRTETKVPKLGVMLVGWGGNNGTTVTAAVLANKHKMSYMTKSGEVQANYFGSITQASTISMGFDCNGKEAYIPMKDMLPMVNPDDIVFDGWDISSLNLADAMERAQVLDIELQRQLKPYMEKMKPRKSVYYPDFIAANQADRADNVLKGSKNDHILKIREDIREFKAESGVEKVIVLWTANTERFSNVKSGLNSTAEELLKSIENDEEEVSPSTIFAVACILEGVTYINGSPQNTFVPGALELAKQKNVFIGGDDFKSGQTKLKSVLVDFLVSAGIKPTSIVSYNHLGNNDGKNLSVPQTFRSKEISKSNVVDDMVDSSRGLLYNSEEHPDHCVVIKYIPNVGDSKRAMDEYTSDLMMGAKNTLVIHNTCEDSMLASPLILDLVIIAEICERITFKVEGDSSYQKFNSVLSILSYLCKAPLVPQDTPLVNALFKQRQCIDNIFRACLGLDPLNNMLLEYKHQTIPERHIRSKEERVGHIISRDNGKSRIIGHGLING